jgi:hypothetical protein
MTFGYSRNSGINWFRNYDDALHKYNSTTDIRGRTEEPMRPLGRRDSTDTYSIRRTAEGAIECVFYTTPVVTFKPDGDIILRDYGYATISTSAFIEEVLGIRAQLFDRSLCIRIGGVGGNAIRLPRGGEGTLTLRRDASGELYAVNPVQDMVHTLDRKESNKVRKQYADFMQYATGMIKLKEGLFTAEELQGNKSTHVLDSQWAKDFGAGIEAFFALLHDKTSGAYESKYIALTSLAASFGQYSYNSQGNRLTLPRFKKAMDDMLFGYYRDQVLVTTPVPVGEVKRDRYSKFYSNGWHKFHLDRAK